MAILPGPRDRLASREAEVEAEGAELSDMVIDCKGKEPLWFKLLRSDRTEG